MPKQKTRIIEIYLPPMSDKVLTRVHRTYDRDALSPSLCALYEVPHTIDKEDALARIALGKAKKLI